MSNPGFVFAGLLRLVGVRQLELARELGVSRSTPAGWLAGYAPMPDEAVLRTHRVIATRLSRAVGDGPTAALPDTPGDRGPDAAGTAAGEEGKGRRSG